METPRKSQRQNKLEVNIPGVSKKLNTITLEGDSSPQNKNSQKSNRSGPRNTETTIQIEDEPAEDTDVNKIVIDSSNNNVIVFNDDDEPPSIGSEDEGPESEKSETQMDVQ